MTRRVHLRITGHVQGVSYRANAQVLASRLGVRGWVRNLPNGDVESVAEASPEPLERYIAWCRRGPTGARVDSVRVDEVNDPSQLGPSFEVRK